MVDIKLQTKPLFFFYFSLLFYFNSRINFPEKRFQTNEIKRKEIKKITVVRIIIICFQTNKEKIIIIQNNQSKTKTISRTF